LANNEIKADSVYYFLFKDENPNKVGIILFFENYSEDDFWKQAGYLFLDEALGEYDVETKLGAIIFDDIKSQYFEHARPLRELATNFDNYFSGSERSADVI
jgi:hypothetical protein